MILDKLEFVKKLVKIVVDEQLDMLEVDNIKIIKSKHDKKITQQPIDKKEKIDPEEDLDKQLFE